MNRKQTLLTTDVNMLEGPILRNLIIFTIPILISYLFQQLYNTADIAIVGNTLGTKSLAAVGSVNAVFDLLIGFSLGLGNGLSIVAARAFGTGDRELLKRAVAGSLVIGIGASICLTVLAAICMRPLLVLIKVPADLMDEAYRYIFIISVCLAVMFAYNLCAGLLRAIGNSLVPLAFLIFSSLLNIGLDLLLITRLGMGVEGAAIATVIAQGVSAVLCVIYILRKTGILVPARKHFSVDKDLYLDLFGQGFSMAFMFSIVNFGSVILQSGINGLADSYIIAAHTAARKLFMFFNIPFISLSMAVATFVSQNKGANQVERIRRCMKETYIFTVFLSAVVALIMLVFAKGMVRMISGTDNETVLINGSLYLKVVAPNYAVLGILLETRNALQGIGKKIVPLISSTIELVMKILFVMVFIPRFAYMAVIACEPVIWVVMTAQLLYSFWRDELFCGKQSRKKL
ncbi:MAG: MATE family efflux transporter [Lachnospiraceae bacterium]|nr:MATE family efflux transporter [Lachnospiraceae bacterium]